LKKIFSHRRVAIGVMLAFAPALAGVAKSAWADGGFGNGGASAGSDSTTGAGGTGDTGLGAGGGAGGGAGVTGGNGGGGFQAAGGAGGAFAGANGAAGGFGNNSGGGGGGGGAHGAVGSPPGGLIGFLTGGRGGAGGDGDIAGGGGGAGGYGVVITGAGVITTVGDIAGGQGGAAGTSPFGTGGAGSGGIGIAFTAPGASLVNSASIISGGAGGGGNSFIANGAGGAGIVGNDLTITNGGTISGGLSVGGSANPHSFGAGGAGIVGSGLTVANSGTISGGLGGNGVTRANAITFTGGINVIELQAGSTITGNVVAFSAGDTFRLGGNANGTFDVSLIGPTAQYQGFGVFEKTGASTWTLTGTTTALTSWTINAGTLQIGAGGATGNLGTGAVTNNAALVFDRSNAITVANAISGTGTVTQNGAGTLTLTGANSYSGATTINSGTLQIGSGATSGTLGAGAVTNNAALVFNRSDAITVANTIGGTGTLTKNGGGTLTLTGANTYSGATTINSGTLAISNDNNLGDASGRLTFAGGTLRFDSAMNSARPITLGGGGATLDTNGNAITLSGVVSDVGTLTKIGTGTLTLSGANTYAGMTSVNAGTLAVNGSMVSITTVNNGGTLGGSGTVGAVSVTSGGMLAPGNSIGTLTVNGNLTFAAGSVFRVETDAAGNADRVNVIGAPGTITINGGTVEVQAGAGTYARNTQYTILSSTGATTGQFTAVTTNLAFLTPTLIYQPNAVLLNVASGATMSYPTVATTRNQTSVANYLDSFANNPGNATAANLIQRIDNLSAQQARTAFDGLSGSSHASASQVSGAVSRMLSGVVMGRADAAGVVGDRSAGFRGVQVARLDLESFELPRAAMSDASLQLAQAQAPSRRARAGEAGFWGQAFGTGGRIDSNGNGPSSSYRAAGFMGGYDLMVTPNWLIGGALGYTPTHWHAEVNGASGSSGQTETPSAALYARYATGHWQLRLNAGYADHKFDTTRDVTIGAATSRLSSTHHGREWSGTTEIEYAMPMGGWELRPLAGVRYANLREKAFTESGDAAAALSVNARTTANLNATAGARLLRPFGGGSGGWEFRAAVSHLFGDRDSPVSARLAGQQASFTADGTPLKRTALTLGAGVAGTIRKNLSAFADISYEARGSGQDAYAVTAGLRIVW